MRGFPAAILSILLVVGCVPGPERILPVEERELPATQVTRGRSGADRDPEVSPDGSLLFYASSSYGSNYDLYFKGKQSNSTVRLTQLPGDERFPKVNPAAPSMLAFCSNARGLWEICIIEDFRSRPSSIRIISDPGTHNIHPSWSADGRLLAYCSTPDFSDTTWILKIYDRTLKRTYALEEIDGLLPEWSPRSNSLVFQRMRHRDRWLGTLWTLEFEAGEARNVTALFSSDDWAAINPSWSPDGRHIVFTTVGKSRHRSGVLNEGDDLWIIEADGGEATRITTSPAADWMPCWAKDGTLYFVSDRGGPQRIWSVKPNLVEIGTPRLPGVSTPLVERRRSGR